MAFMASSSRKVIRSSIDSYQQYSGNDDHVKDCKTGRYLIELQFKFEGETIKAENLTRMNVERQVIVGKWRVRNHPIDGHETIFVNYFSEVIGFDGRKRLAMRTWSFELFKNGSEIGNKVHLSVKGPFLKTNENDSDNHHLEPQYVLAKENRLEKYYCCESYVVWTTMNALIRIAKGVINGMAPKYDLLDNNCRDFANRMMTVIRETEHGKDCANGKVDVKWDAASNTIITSTQLTKYVYEYNSKLSSLPKRRTALSAFSNVRRLQLGIVHKKEIEMTINEKMEAAADIDLDIGGETISIKQALEKYPLEKNSMFCVVL